MSGRLAAVTVAVTRAAASAGPLVAKLEAEGASVVMVPVIGFAPVGDGSTVARAIGSLRFGDVVSVTSTHGAAALVDAEPSGPPDGVVVAAVGPATATPFADTGWSVDVMADTHTASALALEIDRAVAHDPPPRIVYVGAAEPRRDLIDGLRSRGHDVEHVIAYRTTFVRPRSASIVAAHRADAITFTSGSTVRGWLRLTPPPRTPPAISMGPTTSDAARQFGIAVASEAVVQTLDGLVEAIVTWHSS